MSSESINVDNDILTNEINNLNTLLNDISTNGLNSFETEGEGYTKEMMEVVNSSFEGLVSSLELLVSSTVSLLQNISDGYVDADETVGQGIDDFVNEVLGNE